MKIRLFLSIALMHLSILGFSQESRIAILHEAQGFQATTVQFDLGDFHFTDVNTSNGIAKIPVVQNATSLLVKGAPDLPKFTRSLVVPDQGNIVVEVQESEFEEIQNINIAPSIGNLSRTENPANYQRTQGVIFQQDAFFPANEIQLREPYILSGVRGITLLFNPFRYNPVTRTLRIYREITATVKCQTEISGTNERVSNNRFQLVEDQQIHQSHFLNFPVDRYETPTSWGKMLIISHPAFIESLNPFVAWKRATGMEVEVVSYATLGSEAAIQDVIRNRYASGLKYALLVGDIAQIPSPTRNSGMSDPSYGYVEGDDSYPEVFVGRFSAETTADVEVQVAKALQYEQATSGNHFANLTGIASDQGPGDDGELDFEHIRNMEADLLNFTYTASNEFFDGTQGDQDGAGNPNPSMVASAIDAGTGLILYTGHGSSQSFGSSEFSNADIAQLENVGKLPVIWSVACVNGEFNNGTCFGEAWMRARQGNNPTGAASVFMSSINQSWNPPMSAQDEMVDILSGLNASNTGRTFGSISFSGCMLMNDEYGSSGAEMTDSWHIFGDPSLLIRTTAPLPLVVTHPASAVIGEASITVYSEVENARIALVQNGSLLATGLITGGSCLLSFESLSSMSSIQITGTAFNHSPYMGEIQVIAPNSPFFVLNETLLNDAMGNNNLQADFNETVQLNVEVQNVGISMNGSVTGTIAENSPWVSLENPSLTCNFEPTNGNLYLSENCFSFSVSDGVPDQTQVNFLVTLTDIDGQVWNVNIPITLHAPSMQVVSHTFSELIGNNNGRPDPGETVRITLSNLNSGSIESNTGLPNLTFTSSLIEVLSSTTNISSVFPNTSETVSYDLLISPNYPTNLTELFQYEGTFGAYQAQYNFSLLIGAIIEDAESGGLTQFPWINASDSPWFNDNTNAFEGQYSLRSGTIGHNQLTELMLTYQVSDPGEIKFHRKVSSEEGYDFLKFYLDGELQAEWSGDLDWQEFSYPVLAGEHNFTWVYIKDDVFSSLEDAAWVDFIVLPPSDNSASVQEASSQHPVLVFPNPASQIVQLSGLNSCNYTIEWLDLSGRKLASNQITASGANSTFLSIPDGTSDGLYFLRIQSENWVKSLPVSVRR